MDNAKICIREMKDGEQKEIKQLGRRSFPLFEALFVSTPEKAMVAECGGRIIGSILYKPFHAKNKSAVYIDEAFVAPGSRGTGTGKRLYQETFEHLRAQGHEVMTALVKDDNVGSWKLFLDNGFKRAGPREVIRQIGIAGLIWQCIKTPWLFAAGMDFYMAAQKEAAGAKRPGPPQLLLFLLANLLLHAPLWGACLYKSPETLGQIFGAYTALLLLFIGCRYAGGAFRRERWRFRLNNGGSLLILLLSFFGCPFFMNANWYPERYEKTEEFRRKMAVPELIKWVVFLLLPLLAFAGGGFFTAAAKFACTTLVHMSIPFYPFEALGAGRVYRYSRKIWLLLFAVTLLELCLVFNFAN